ncbi:hypothetical protein Kpol_289p1 [Vanderwaltozyma polyspora DSM 70294]|uniref:Uncharacterized protein n=1 Tax=Vanderwaltozyma polyspora (strain ATCC 22028 / DSM 70294 / BCRC 21397 / CBS 2163 / NBRC 10782 / NRRL Y-8283 / UCD 57-17) TaxID=436907 RepID=A7TT29_VANPO|nr:uncharacterized protein Kpol_289p1 [Vanderwaltozyma polyspora DSM 70294]EDO14576.1 hypothetical protein Kpol_289p1 [Vanderwaltozyma polyspora DSM 70294]
MSAILEPLVRVVEYVESLNAEYLSKSSDELKAMTLFERASIYDWRFEMTCTVILILVYLMYFIGISTNKRHANRLFKKFNSYLKNDLEFSRVAFTDYEGKQQEYLDQHQYSWFTTFATGRSSIESITMRAHLLPRSNLLSIIFEYAIAYFFPSLAVRDLDEFAQVIIKPNGVYAANADSKINANAGEILGKLQFITSIVNKDVMNDSRSNNYFLSLTHTSESDKLPVEYVYMSEANQFNGFFHHYIKETTLNPLLKNCSRFLQFISFTDLPIEKPLTQKLFDQNQSPKCIIRVKFPKSNEEIELLQKLVSSIVEVFDNCTRDLIQDSSNKFLTNDLLKKSVTFRSQEIDRINKLMKQAELEVAKEKKLELEKERRRQLKESGELSKIDQKMKEKRERRQRNKQRVKM